MSMPARGSHGQGGSEVALSSLPRGCGRTALKGRVGSVLTRYLLVEVEEGGLHWSSPSVLLYLISVQ